MKKFPPSSSYDYSTCSIAYGVYGAYPDGVLLDLVATLPVDVPFTSVGAVCNRYWGMLSAVKWALKAMLFAALATDATIYTWAHPLQDHSSFEITDSLNHTEHD